MEYDGKRALKDAKEAVKNKNFNAAMELCKSILKNEKNNYLAWVLSAVAFQELGQVDKALAAFLKATELQPSQLTAWQGLAAFLEQERSKGIISTDNGENIKEATEKLASTYLKLEELLVGDAVKQMTIWKKQCELYGSLMKIEECLVKVQVLLKKGDAEVMKLIIKVLHPLLPKLSSKGIDLMEEALLKLIPLTEDPDEITNLDEQYLRILLKKHCYDKGSEVARRILQRIPANITASEAVCQIFVENPSSQFSVEEVSKAVADLAITHPASEYIMQAKAAVLLQTGSILEAQQLLESVCLKKKTEKTLWLLSEAHLQLHHWDRSENICYVARELSLTEDEAYKWNMKLAKSLLEQNTAEKLRETGIVLSKCPEEKQEDLSIRLLQALYYLRSANIDRCADLLNSLEAQAKDDTNFVILKSEYFQASGHPEKSISLLEEHITHSPQNVDLQLALAKILWNGGHRQKSVAHLLVVIKGNRDLAEPYVLLGTFYGDQTDVANLQRGIRCLEKAFHLEPHQLQTAKQLLDLYRRTGNVAAALKLLDVVINCSSSDGCRWAWVQKGRFHLECMRAKDKTSLDQEKEATLAIGCFQNALRADSNDSSCWETLGDAYMARGSFTAALRAFQKAASLNPDSIYSAYQTANVKQKLGEYSDAIDTYEQLLARCPDYVPALKGLAETLLNQATDFETDGFTGRLRDECARALNLLVKAVRIKSHFSCLWSLMGRISLLLRVIPETEFRFQVPALLLSSSGGLLEEEASVTKKQMMELGVKFHLAAIQTLPDSACLWYNLSLCYQACAQLTHEDPSTHMNAAMVAVKKAITLEPNESMFWNLLGLVAQQPSVSQHAFIRAVELNPKAAAAWTNLGTLYYEYGDPRLAHECFKRAQNADPFYVPAWIGQANVAEQLKPAEAMDLFRHTVAIGSGRRAECEGALPYAQWVLSTLSDPKGKQKPHYRYSIVEMHAVPAAVDGLTSYTTLYPEDSCALNILGLLYERQGLLQRAEEVLLRGIAVLKEKDCSVSRIRMDKMKANLARVYTSMDQCDNATELYASLQESELSSACGIALAHFRAGRFEESYVTYEAALHWLASDDSLRSHLLVAMAMAAYRRDLSDPEAAQTLLFQSCQLQPPSVYGLLALAALGLLTDDDTLTDAAFQEMLAYHTEPRYVDRIAFLKAFRHWSSGNSQEASRELCRHIHMLPNISHLWVQLASFQAAAAVHESQSSPSYQPIDGLLVARCAQIASNARQYLDTTTDDEHQVQPVDLSKVTSLTGIGYLLAGEKEASLIAAQKAVHCNPQSAAAWSVLLAAAVSSWTSKAPQPFNSDIQLLWLKQLIGHLRRHCDVAAFSGLAPWLGSYERRLASLLSQI